MPENFWLFAFLCACAFFAGVLNSVAGGGTLLTFPALAAALGSPALANGTSTVALLPGSFAGALGYRKELWECRRFVARMLLPSVAGGFLGAWLVGKDQDAFAKLVPWLILTAALLFVVQAPLSAWVKRRAAADGANPDHHQPGALTQSLVIAFQFLVAVYGGYFGAGIGILMLSALGFMGVGDIHRMNAVKTFLAASINAASVVVFVRDDLVRWNYALPMMGAAIAGGYLGARVARRLPARYVRYAVIVIGFGLAAYYFLKQYLLN
ncbi:MAG: sulfite exporter TauE/SafE family protein [Planctomycetes bacterium]|nr:sulfite exporter TauE/SafE family protein [Planctomycetota bacterium]